MSKKTITLKEARLLLKLTQVQMADHLGISERTYIRYEHGAAKPTALRLIEATLKSRRLGDFTLLAKAPGQGS